MSKYAFSLLPDWPIELLWTRIAVVGKTKVYQLEYLIPAVAEGECLGREAKHTRRQMGIVSISAICSQRLPEPLPEH